MKNAILTYKSALYVSVALFAGFLTVFTLFAAADFSEGLILHHPYDEGEGALAADLSGNGHDGEISNPEWTDGKFGKHLSLVVKAAMFSSLSKAHPF